MTPKRYSNSFLNNFYNEWIIFKKFVYYYGLAYTVEINAINTGTLRIHVS